MSTLLKALKTAISIEDNGLMTFLKFARQTENITGKNMFILQSLSIHNGIHVRYIAYAICLTI